MQKMICPKDCPNRCASPNCHNAATCETWAKHEAEVASNTLLASGVVVLPCKVGDTVYLINDGKIYEATVYRIEYIDHDQFGIATTVSARTQPSYSFGIRFDDFGKTVFFTREEAEAALKKMEGEK